MKKLPEQAKHKQAKLLKTRIRRERQAQQRELAEAGAHSRRNDLLPELELRKYRTCELRAPKHRTRKSDPKQIARHVRLIGEFGFSEPVLVRDGQHLFLIGCQADGFTHFRILEFRPVDLHAQLPRVYRRLADFYRQDPALAG